MAVSGVINSCDTSASSCRRALSDASSASRARRRAPRPSVERARHGRHFVAAAVRRARRQVAGAEPVGRFLQCFMRRRAGPNTTSAISPMPTTSTAAADQAHVGAELSHDDRKGGPPRQDGDRPTGMPPATPPRTRRSGTDVGRRRAGRRRAGHRRGGSSSARADVARTRVRAAGSSPRRHLDAQRGAHLVGTCRSWLATSRPSLHDHDERSGGRGRTGRATYSSRSSAGIGGSSAAPTSDATSTASRRGRRAGIDPAMRSVIQTKQRALRASINARNADSPSAMRQYRLRYQTRTGSDIGGLVARAPDREDHGRLRRVVSRSSSGRA